MDNIYISSPMGKTIVIPIPSSKFKNVKISKLKSKILVKTGIEVELQRLLFQNKVLESECCGRIMTLSDYDIKGNAIIELVKRLGFNPLTFADITSKDKLIPLEFTSSGPKWRSVNSGLNFEGTCKQFGCDALNNTVIVNKGFYKSSGGQCVLNFEISNLECPMCHVKLNKKEVLGVGIYKCQLTVKCKQEEEEEISYDIVSKDKYQYAGCIGEKDKIQYEYIMLLVKKLK